MEKSGRISRLSLLLADWPQADQSHGWAFQFQREREASRGVRLTNNLVKILRRADETRFDNRSAPPWNVCRSHAQARLRAGEVTDENRRRGLRRVHARTEPGFRVAATNIPWRSRTIVETRVVGATGTFDQVVRETNATSSFTVTLELKSPAVALIRLRPIRE